MWKGSTWWILLNAVAEYTMTRNDGCITMVCFGDSWDEFERRDMMLLSRLARHERVRSLIYVEPPVTLSSLVKFTLRRADYYGTSTWRRILKTGMICRQNEKIWIIRSIAALPFRYLGPLRDLNIFLLNLTRTWLAKRVLRGEHADVLWISIPHFTADLIKHFGAPIVCYSLCEDWTAKEKKGSWSWRALTENDRRITEAADLVLAASPELCTRKALVNSHVHLVPNGVDSERIRSAAQFASMPVDLHKIPLPRIGHVGFLGPYTDFSLLELLARHEPPWSLVLIGPVSKGFEAIERLKGFKNVYFLGPRPAHTLYPYLVHFDACILLYRLTEQNLLRSSMKLYQYLAAGKPIVSYPVGGAQEIPYLVHVAHNPDQFISLLEQALSNDSPQLAQARIDYARQNSWDVRADQIARLLFDTVDRKRTGRK